MASIKILFVAALVIVFCTEFSNAAEGYQTTALNTHNNYRSRHHSPHLIMDENLNAAAIKCAQYYAQHRTIDHSCPFKNGAGENLYMHSAWTAEEFASQGTKGWYDEVNKYDYNNPGFSGATGHFTQIVWKSSARFGFGVALANGYNVAVGLYTPHGNMIGDFPANVLRP